MLAVALGLGVVEAASPKRRLRPEREPQQMVETYAPLRQKPDL